MWPPQPTSTEIKRSRSGRKGPQKSSLGKFERWKKPLKIISFNTRHLVAVDKELRDKKLKYLETVIKDADLVQLQEVQQDEAALMQASPLLMALFHVHFCEGPGGVVTLWRRASFPVGNEGSNLTSSPYVPGRVQRSSWTDGNIHVVTWNVHNYALTPHQAHSVAEAIQRDQSSALLHPESFILLVAGDWNFLPEDDCPHDVKTPDRQCERQVAPAARAGAWLQALDKLTEVRLSAPSHYAAGAKTVARLDRFYLGGPAHDWSQTFVSPGQSVDPVSLFYRGISDHAPTMVRIGARRSPRPGRHPIDPTLSKHKLYKGFLRDALPVNYSNFHVRLKHPALKKAMSQAANKVRKYIIATEPSAQLAQKFVYLSVARLLRTQKKSHYEAFVAGSAVAADLLQIDDFDVISLRRPVEFAERYDQLHREHPDEEVKRLEAAANSQDKRRKRGSLARRAARWSPFGKRIYLGAVQNEDKTILYTDDASKQQVLAGYWKQVFEKVYVPHPGLFDYVKRNTRRWNLTGLHVPEEEDFGQFYEVRT